MSVLAFLNGLRQAFFKTVSKANNNLQSNLLSNFNLSDSAFLNRTIVRTPFPFLHLTSLWTKRLITFSTRERELINQWKQSAWIKMMSLCDDDEVSLLLETTAYHWINSSTLVSSFHALQVHGGKWPHNFKEFLCHHVASLTMRSHSKKDNEKNINLRKKEKKKRWSKLFYFIHCQRVE